MSQQVTIPHSVVADIAAGQSGVEDAAAAPHLLLVFTHRLCPRHQYLLCCVLSIASSQMVSDSISYRVLQ